MERLMDEAEDEFEFQEEKVRITPRVFVPEPEVKFDPPSQNGPPPFCNEFIVNKHQRQPVEVKLDSILIKGSKVIANHPKGEYVQGSLYLMAQTYFYKEEWLPSQIKCGELIDKYPDGELSPDAHLLLSKGLLIQQKFYSGKIMLSRTVDIAWQLKRYDILSEAFRLQAELALYQDDLDGAMRPYKQAIVQSDDGEMQAKWQLDMAALLFRIREFERAEVEFRKVHRFSPDYITTYEAYLYQASSLARIGRFKEADEILEELADDGKWEEWLDYTFAQQLQVERLKKNHAQETETEYNEEIISEMESNADSLYVNNPGLAAYYFEKGMDYYKQDNYSDARSNFAKARLTKSPVTHEASQLFTLINEWDIKRRRIKQFKFKHQDEEYPDSVKSEIAANYFELGRIHSQLQNEDSVSYYYQKAAEMSDPKKDYSAKYLYAYSLSIREDDPYKSDSLLDLIVEYHPLTEYGEESQNMLGYTEAFVIDTAAELYDSGTDLMKFNDFNYAIAQFWRIYRDFGKSDYAPRALYAIGWLYENEIQMPDSAKYYYNILVKKYPDSEYAKDLKLTMDYTHAVESGEPIPDSLKTRQLREPPPDRTMEQLQREQFEASIRQQRNPVKESGLSPRELLDNPGRLLENAKGLMQDPTSVIKNLEVPELPTSPESLLKSPFGSSDSTSTEEVDPVIPDSTNSEKK